MVQNQTQTKKTSKPKRPPHLSYKSREFFVGNLGLLLKSGVTVSEALVSLAHTSANATLRKALLAMQSDIEAGYNLADALEHSGMASGQSLALVRLGEASGRLVENLELAAQQEGKRRILRTKVRSALIYPVFVMSLTVIVGLGVAWFLLPKLAGTFSQLHVELPLISEVIIQFGLFLRSYGIYAVPASLGFVLVMAYFLFVAPRTKVIGQTILLSTPGIGRLMREVEVAQFGYLLGTLLNTGLPVTQALILLADASTTHRYKKFYEYLANSLDEGYSFKDSMARSKSTNKVLPAAIQQMVIAGERSGSLSEVLDTVGRTYEQKSDTTTANLEAIIEPLMLIIVWFGVMVVAVAVILPIYSLVGGLQ